MKICPKCGAPQADIMPTCDLCGSLFPGEKRAKPRFDATGVAGLAASILAIIGAVAFFYLVETDADSDDPKMLIVIIVVAIVSMFFAATGPIAGFILSLVGIRKTRDKDVNGRGFALAGLIVSALMLVVSMLFIVIMIYVFAEVLK